MKKRYRDFQPMDQPFLLPPALQDWLPADHLVYFFNDVVDALDLSSIVNSYEKELRGYPPYSPQLMVKILLYAYATGTYSSRKIEKRLYEDVSMRVLAGNTQPDFRTISNFRKRHLDAFSELFLEVVRVAKEAGLIKLSHVSLDGTKVKANASKHKAMSYGRMVEHEKRLTDEIKQLLNKAEEVDEAEDAAYGADRRGDELPAELANRQSRLAKIREAKAALEAQAKAKAEEEQKEQAPAPEKSTRNRKRKLDPAQPKSRDQRNFTDPDSRIMKDSNRSFVQAYNCQVAVDPANQIIVAQQVTNQAADTSHLTSVVEQVKENLGELPDELSADPGYFSNKNINFLLCRGVEPFIPADKLPHRYKEKLGPAPKGAIPASISPRDRMRRMIRTKRGQQRYSIRQTTVEPVFGQIKHGRGFRQFLTRGLNKVTGEWSLVCLVHNLLKMAKHRNKVIEALA